jgi:hypothetical protein
MWLELNTLHCLISKEKTNLEGKCKISFLERDSLSQVYTTPKCKRIKKFYCNIYYNYRQNLNDCPCGIY